MVLEGFEHSVELPVPELLHLVEPSGEVQPCLFRLGLPVEDVDQLQEDVICLFQPWEKPEEDFGSPLLLLVPLRLVLEFLNFKAQSYRLFPKNRKDSYYNAIKSQHRRCFNMIIIGFFSNYANS